MMPGIWSLFREYGMILPRAEVPHFDHADPDSERSDVLSMWHRSVFAKFRCKPESPSPKPAIPDLPPRPSALNVSLECQVEAKHAHRSVWHKDAAKFDSRGDRSVTAESLNGK